MRTRIPTALLLSSVVLSLAPTGCGGGGGSHTDVSVTVSPASITLPPGGVQTFSATVTGSSVAGVSWSVQEGSAGGGINSGGTYAAPMTAGSYHVVAASLGDPSKSAVATVTVPVMVSVSPVSATLTVGDTQSFTATVLGSANTAVAWSIQEGAAGGSIAPTGVYTPPNRAGTYHVVATSQADPARSAVATALVQTASGSVTVQ